MTGAFRVITASRPGGPPRLDGGRHHLPVFGLVSQAVKARAEVGKVHRTARAFGAGPAGSLLAVADRFPGVCELACPVESLVQGKSQVHEKQGLVGMAGVGRH